MADDRVEPAAFLDCMSIAARQVGAVALRFYGKVANLEKEVVGREFANDDHRAALQALSDVDLAAQEILLIALAEGYPFVAVDPEEDTPGVAAFADNVSRYTVVLDPIDGTLNYITQHGKFGVMVGLMEDERYVAGLVYFPLDGRLYRAVRNEGCTVTIAGIERPVRTGETPALVFYDAATPAEAAAAIESVGVSTTRSGCSAVDSTVAATGEAAAALSYHQPSVRRCIGALVSREAGGYLCDLQGRPYDCTHPSTLDNLLVARDRAFAEVVLGALDGASS
jgi:fructose-1,6-bisphosphatase/inositol monophosphatase family enzyme